MKIYTEDGLRHFKFWSEAANNAKLLSLDELEEIEAVLEDFYPDGISDVRLNDLFWFDFDAVLEWVDKWQCENCGEIVENGDRCECEEEEEDEDDDNDNEEE